MINKKIKQRGFTLMETLVAILLLSMAITGPLTIASKGIQATTIAKDEDSAFYLAQDAVEYVRFARDTNRLAGTAAQWLTGNGNTNQTISLANCISTDGSRACYLDSLSQNPTAPTACSANPCTNNLYYDPNNLWYTYNTTNTTQTPFIRTVSITNPIGGNADEASLVVTVSWTDPLAHSITVRENIFNWQ